MESVLRRQLKTLAVNTNFSVIVLSFWLKTQALYFHLDSCSVFQAAEGRDHFDVRLLVAGHVPDTGGGS